MYYFLRSRVSLILLIGYLLLLSLFASVMIVDHHIQKEQNFLITESYKVVNKVKLIVDIIEISKYRVNLAYKMVHARDFFERDLIYHEILNHSTKFEIKHKELIKNYELPKSSLDAIKDFDIDIDVIINSIENIEDLSFEMTRESEEASESIIGNILIPKQEKIVENYLNILTDSQTSLQEKINLSEHRKTNNEMIKRYTIWIVTFLSFLLFLKIFFHITTIERELNELSLIDNLTGLYNRRGMTERINRNWKFSSRSKHIISLMMIDIDYFKKYNDTYGHQIGDECLVKVARIIGSIPKRGTDTAARYGGEEFTLILPGASMADCEKLAGKLQRNIQEYNQI